MMRRWKRWRAERRWQQRLAEAWKPEYDLLARFNRDESRGLCHQADFRAFMRRVQRDYNTNYVPLLSDTQEGK